MKNAVLITEAQKRMANFRKESEIDRINKIFAEIGAPDDVPISTSRELKWFTECGQIVTKKCETCGKTAYESEQSAKKSMHHAQRTRNVKLRVYFSEECQCYHLSSSIKKF